MSLEVRHRALTVLGALALVVSLPACAAPSPSSTPPPSSASPSATELPRPSTSPMPSVTTTPSPGKTEVSLTIVTIDVVDGVLEATALIPEVVESGGECELEIESGRRSESSSVDANAATASTDCGLMTIDVSDFPSGEALVTVTYDSAAHQGMVAQTVEIP